MKERKGFTLIELLVVISIIALLLAILMPALGKVKEKAKAVVCQSQVKQWGLAWTLYAVDHNDKTITHEASMFWFYKIAPYMADNNVGQVGGFRSGSMEVLQCPSTRRWVPGRGGNEYSWGCYGTADSTWRFKQSQGTGADGTYTEGSYTANGWMLSLNNPGSNKDKYFNTMSRTKSDTPLLADGGYLRAGPLTEHASTSTQLVDLKGGGKGDATPMSDAIERLLLNRHSMATCVAFADGHADRVKLSKMWSLYWHPGFERVNELELPNR